MESGKFGLNMNTLVHTKKEAGDAIDRLKVLSKKTGNKIIGKPKITRNKRNKMFFVNARLEL